MRLRRHAESAFTVATWLSEHPRVGAVLHPAFPGSPGHALWKRDFSGSNGLLSFELLDPAGKPADPPAAARVADALVATGRFTLGFSWGGFESLVMPGALPDGSSHMARTVHPWMGGTLLRLHIGLEPVGQLIEALEQALSC